MTETRPVGVGRVGAGSFLLLLVDCAAWVIGPAGEARADRSEFCAKGCPRLLTRRLRPHDSIGLILIPHWREHMLDVDPNKLRDAKRAGKAKQEQRAVP
jgi:hypothetical protein